MAKSIEAGLKEIARPAIKRFKVELSHSPTRVVESGTPESAWTAYMRSCGLVGTEHTPQISEVTDDGAGKPQAVA